MEYKKVNNFEVSVIGFGTHLIGGKAEPDLSQDKKYIKVIKEAIKLGINHIDTSEVYGNGHTEEIIGKAISGFDRKKLFIASKVWHTNLKHDDLLNSLKSSLKRLKTDYLDLYYAHNPNPNINLKETMLALEEAKNLGLIKNIGVSNFSLELLKEAQSYLTNSRIIALQLEYSLLNKSVETFILPYCLKENIILVAYKPLGKGIITNTESEILEELSDKYKKTKSQIALNWLITQNNVIVIPKVSTLKHLKENLGSIDWILEKKDILRLRELSIS